MTQTPDVPDFNDDPSNAERGPISRNGRAWVMAKMADCKTIKELQAAWDSFGLDVTHDKACQRFKTFMKQELSNDRSTQQNRLMWKWCEQAARDLGGTKEDVQAWAKLTIGVPILRSDDEAFRERYDRIVRPLSYETKLEIMREFDFPVTSLMKTKQMVRFMDILHQKLTEQGLRLVEPEPDLSKHMAKYREEKE